MIKLPTAREYGVLKSFKDPHCLTLYVPFVNPNTESSPNLITFKNLVKQGAKMLEKEGLSPVEVKKILKPARKLIEDPTFWQNSHAELVFFIAPKLFQYFYIPNTGKADQIVLGTGFSLEPLEKILRNNKQYYVLTISHHAVQMYEGDNYRLKPLLVKKLPSSMKETLGIDEFPHSRQLHSVAPASSGKGSEGYHQQYDVSKTDKKMLIQYFRQVDKILHGYLKDKKKPLIIGGVEYLIPIYQETNTYPHILQDGIKGNLEKVSLSNLHQKAMNLLRSK